jgi:hypothetical protein
MWLLVININVALELKTKYYFGQYFSSAQENQHPLVQ